MQSTMCYNASANRAVDGIASSDFYDGSCSHTCGGGWWSVDFAKTAHVQAVRITNRGRQCNYQCMTYIIFARISAFAPLSVPSTSYKSKLDAQLYQAGARGTKH